MITGDYDRRMRGLRALFRPTDPVAYGILLTEMSQGVCRGLAGDMTTPYIILRAYAATKGTILGSDEGPWVSGHIMGYLASSIRLHGAGGHWPPLVISAYEEFENEKVRRVFYTPNQSRTVKRNDRH